ncbi:MAG TPA: Ig-like domain-containing protein [Vicinamibacterales bacterium]|nr:Ig-like domain-containing protein [Vicinamibacterales bacterium]
MTPQSSASRITAIQIGVAANSDPTLVPGATLQLWAVETYADGSTADATNLAEWQSSDTGIATISSSGLLSAGAVGTTTVTAVHEKAGKLEVRVRPPGCEDLIVSPSSRTIVANPDHCVDCDQIHGETIVVRAPAADCQWSVSSDAPWLRNHSRPSGSGSGLVVYTVEPNTLAINRVGNVIIGVGTRQLTHRVTQLAVGCSFAVTPASAVVKAGATAFVDVTVTPETCHWVATTAGSVSEINVLDYGVRKGSGRVRYQVSATASANVTRFELRDAYGASPSVFYRVRIQR